MAALSTSDLSELVRKIIQFLNQEQRKAEAWLETLPPAQAVVLPHFYTYFLKCSGSVLHGSAFFPDEKTVQRFRDQYKLTGEYLIFFLDNHGFWRPYKGQPVSDLGCRVLYE
jgi:hypothetical protein